GFLFLGKSEMLIKHSQYFSPVDTKQRIFTPVPRVRIRELPAEMAIGDGGADQRHADLRRAAAGATPLARLAGDGGRVLWEANERARDYFNIGPADLGRPFQDLDLSYRPLDLRSPLDRVLETRKAQDAGRGRWGDPPNQQTFDVGISPVIGTNGDLLGASIAF